MPLPNALDTPTPLESMMRAASPPLRAVDIASRSGCSVNAVNALRRLDPVRVSSMSLDVVCRVALALGCAPAELVPWLASTPRTGLLYERGARVAYPRRRSPSAPK